MTVSTNVKRYALIGVLIALFALIGFAATAYSPSSPQRDNIAQAIEAFETEPEQQTRRLELFIEIIDGCSTHVTQTCAHAHASPGESSPSVAALRTGTVLKVHSVVSFEGEVWYRIVFDEWLRYPERVAPHWYVSSRYVRLFHDEGTLELEDSPHATTTKWILVDRSDNTLTAYDGDEVIDTYTVSIGLPKTPTPRGEFTIYRKTPSRYMQGPLPGISAQHFDLPGVPWNLYFTRQGGVIHGAYWHDSFGSAWSNGCVNVRPEEAEELYRWADIGTRVLVRD